MDAKGRGVGLNRDIDIVARRFGAAGLNGFGDLNGGFDQFQGGLAFLFLGAIGFANSGGLNLRGNGADVIYGGHDLKLL
jgi:hypothetical protein